MHILVQNEDFLCFPDLKIIDSFLTGLQKISAHAFKHIRGLKRLDLSDNGISNIDYNAFDEVNMDFIGLYIIMNGVTIKFSLKCVWQLTYEMKL